MKSYKHHLEYYLPLLAILVGGFLTMLLFEEKSIKISLLVLTGVFYAIWGIIHHYLKHNLTLEIIMEYVIVGALGISVILFILMGVKGS
ncbi:hypothetical protein KKG52_02920 [Patescibacteria group bacterium]|nr:hypothetical protein [Patescibacteria group bacterium]